MLIWSIPGLLLWISFWQARTQALMVVIDNTDPRIEYFGEWRSFDFTRDPDCSSAGSSRTICETLRLDGTKMNLGTVNMAIAGDTTEPTGFNFTWHGPLVQIRTTHFDEETDVFPTNTFIEVVLDGVSSGTRRESRIDQGFNGDFRQYANALFNTSLPDTQHTMLVQVVEGSSLILDYLLINETEPATTPGVGDFASSSTSSTFPLPTGPKTNAGTENPKEGLHQGAIIGLSLGAAVLLLSGVVCVLFLKRRRQKKQLVKDKEASPPNTDHNPFTPFLANQPLWPSGHLPPSKGDRILVSGGPVENTKAPLRPQSSPQQGQPSGSSNVSSTPRASTARLTTEVVTPTPPSNRLSFSTVHVPSEQPPPAYSTLSPLSPAESTRTDD